MATLLHGESRRMYSWWWDSHISPKNSRWLQENLTDMDIKVKSMIKLLEEDADSFARRAEMYYKKRPELMKLVEEFYRAYRALAERYDHATGALRQAHRTMAEAFPNQIPLILSDESSSSTGMEPHTPEMPPPMHAFLDPDDLQKDAPGLSSHFHSINRNGAYSDDNDSLLSKKGLKQLNEMFETGEGAGRPRLSEGKVKKGLIFHEEAIKSPEFKRHNGPTEPQKNCLAEKEAEIKCLQEKVSKLSTEKHDLENQVASVLEHAEKAEIEVYSLKEALSIVNSEKEASLVQYQLSVERISALEAEIVSLQEAFKNLDDEKAKEASKSKIAEQSYLKLEKKNQKIQLEVDILEQKSKSQEEELGQKQEEMNKLSSALKDGQEQRIQAETALHAMEKLHSQSQQEVRSLAFEVQNYNERLNGMEQSLLDLKEEVKHLKVENCNLHEQNLSSALLMKNLQDEIIFLKKTKGNLEDEVQILLDEKKVIQQEFDCLKEERKNLEQRHQYLDEQLKVVRSNAESLQILLKELKDENAELKSSCKKHEEDQVLHLENLKHIEKLSQMNSVLEISLSASQVELEGLREKIKSLQSIFESLQSEIAVHISEKALLVNKVEIISQNMKELSEQNAFLENSLSDANGELEILREEFKKSEESYQVLQEEQSKLRKEKNSLDSQVKTLGLSLENMEKKYAELEGQNLILEEQKASFFCRLRELHDCLNLEKQKHEKYIQLSKNQEATLEHQIYLLQEALHLKEQEFVFEEERNLNADLEIFILRRCLSDMKERNTSLSVDYQKRFVASLNLEKLISQLEQEDILQKDKLIFFSTDNEKLREGLHLLFKMFNISRDFGSLVEMKDEELIQIIMAEIRNSLDTISDAQDKNEQLLLEKSVNVTLLQQLGLELANMRSEKDLIQQEAASRTNELLLLQSKINELIKLTEQLRQTVGAGRKREEAQNNKLDNLSAYILDLEGLHQISQVKICRLTEENLSLSMRLQELEKEKVSMEEEVSAILMETMKHEHLYLICRSVCETELKLSSDALDCLCAQNNKLSYETGILNAKLGTFKRENMHLKEQVCCLEECKRQVMALERDLSTSRYICQQLNLRIENGDGLLLKKEAEVLAVNQKLQEAQQTSQREISKLIEESKYLSEKLHTLNEEKTKVQEENNILTQEYIMMECLYLIFRSLGFDRASEIKFLGNDLNFLHSVNNDLNQTIRSLDEKMGELEVENVHLKESVVCLEECRHQIRTLENDLNTVQNACKQLNHQIEIKKDLVMQKELELLEANQKAQEAYHSAQKEICKLNEENECLSKNLCDLTAKMNAVEEENTTTVAEALALECLYLISVGLLADRATELKLFGNDLDHLHGMNHKLEKELRILNGKIGTLEEENMQLCKSKLYLEECRKQLQEAVQRSEIDIHNLIEENRSFSKKFSELMEKNEIVVEDNEAILAEAVTLEFLELMFRSLSAERAMELKSISDDLKYLHEIKDDLDQQIIQLNEKIAVLEAENMHLEESVVHLEECRNRLIILEDELGAAKIANEQLNLQVVASNNSLSQKDMEFSEANKKVLLIQDKNAELDKRVWDLKQDIDGARVIREDLEKKILNLSEVNDHKDKEIMQIREVNELLEQEIEKLHKETEVLRDRERSLTSELQKERVEVELSEQEIVTLLNDIQMLTVNASILEEKLLEMLLACESLELGAIVHREMLNKEIDAACIHVDGLQKELYNLKKENTRMKGDLNAYMSLAMHLSGNIASLDENMLSLKNLCVANHQESKENVPKSHELQKSGSEQSEECSPPQLGVSKLQESIYRVEALQKVVAETKSFLEKKLFNPSVGMDDEIKTAQEKAEANKHSTALKKEDEFTGRHIKLHEDGTEASKAKHGQMMKDIQLDKVSSSSLYGKCVSSYSLSRINAAETDDQMLELWETAETDCINQMRKESSATTEHDIEYHEIETVEEDKSECPSSELMTEKELSIDKLELPRRDTESHQEWRTKVINKLVCDSQRLSALQTSVHQLKQKMESSEKRKHSASIRYDTLKAQLKEAEEALTQLIDNTNKLTKRAEDYSDNSGREKEQMETTGRRRLAERARRGSENVGGLELELQKIQYIMLKLEEEHESRRRAFERKSSVLLRDYLYGRREKNKHRKGLCGCMRPKTNGD